MIRNILALVLLVASSVTVAGTLPGHTYTWKSATVFVTAGKVPVQIKSGKARYVKDLFLITGIACVKGWCFRYYDNYKVLSISGATIRVQNVSTGERRVVRVVKKNPLVITINSRFGGIVSYNFGSPKAGRLDYVNLYNSWVNNDIRGVDTLIISAK